MIAFVAAAIGAPCRIPHHFPPDKRNAHRHPYGNSDRCSGCGAAVQDDHLLIVEVGGHDRDVRLSLSGEVSPGDVGIDSFGLQSGAEPREEGIAGIKTATLDERKQFTVEIDCEKAL